MVPCTTEHFNFDDKFKSFEDDFPIADGLCPEIGQAMTIGGKSTSKKFSKLFMEVVRCDPSADPSCASDAFFSQFLTNETRFEMRVLVIQPSINAGM